MRNRMYGGVRGRKTKVGRKLLRFPPTRLLAILYKSGGDQRPPPLSYIAPSLLEEEELIWLFSYKLYIALFT